MPFSFILQKHETELIITCCSNSRANDSSVFIKQTQYYKEEASEHTGGGPLVRVCKDKEAERQKTSTKGGNTSVCFQAERRGLASGSRLLFVCCLLLNEKERERDKRGCVFMCVVIVAQNPN